MTWAAGGVIGSQVTQEFVVGMHSAFLVSPALGLVAAGFSFVRGREDRRQPVREAIGGE